MTDRDPGDEDDAKVVTLRPKGAQRLEDSSVITILESALKQARVGELDGIAMAAVRTDGSTYTGISKCDHATLLLGATSFCLYTLQMLMMQGMDNS